jgi:uncharacterized protein (DUF1697 family)
MLVMTTYVALLRGINVGRNQRIAMADLRRLLTGLGHGDVRTLLQSGNAVFTSSRRSGARLAAELEAAIAKEFGLGVRCLVLSAAELRAVAEENPLEIPDGSRFLVSFLFGAVPAGARKIDAGQFAPEQVAVGSRAIYLWCVNGILESTILGEYSEKALGLTATNRNWNTVAKLLALAET